LSCGSSTSGAAGPSAVQRGRKPQGSGFLHQVPGGSSDYRGVALVTLDIQAVAATRRDASALARSARQALVHACRARFANTEGYLGAFRDVSGLPTELRGAGPADDPHTFFRFQGTYQCVVRPAK